MEATLLMRSFSIFLSITLLFVLSSVQLFASQASRFALGDPAMVLEEESTVSSILNYGNPAGLAFLSNQTRLDLTTGTTYTLGREKFITGRADHTYWDGSNTVTATFDHITPRGLTLPANTLYVKDTYQMKNSFNNYENYYLSGYIFSPYEKLVVQVNPLTTHQRLALDEDLTPFKSLTGGVIANSAYRLNDQSAIGAGFSYQRGQADGWSQTTISSFLGSSLINQISNQNYFSAQLGFSTRLYEVFGKDDHLDGAIHLQASQMINQGDYTFFQPSLADHPSAHVTNEIIPWSVAIQSLYHYKKVMDIGFEIGYTETKDQYQWSSDYFNDQSKFGYSTLYNIFYELQFRARLPMVREDDLRFGVSFNNKGIGNHYPTGNLQLDFPDTITTVPEINTTSSNIAIEIAMVPVDSSIFSIKYHLGSSNSYQGDEFIDDVGYTDFTFSSQYKFWDHLLIRASYSNVRLASELNLTKLVFIEETGTFRFGIGYTEDNFDIDLYAGAFRKLYKPVTNTSATDVYERGLEGMLSFIYRY